MSLDYRIVTRYTHRMIRSFMHKGLEKFFSTGSKAGIQAVHAARLGRMLLVLNRARTPHEMDVPGWKLHPLQGKPEGRWSVWVSGNWRLTFRFVGEDVEIVNYEDYH